VTGRALAVALAVALLAAGAGDALLAPARAAARPAAAEPVTTEPAPGEQDGFDRLGRAVRASRGRAYAGEALWVTYDTDRRAHVRTFTLRATAGGEITLTEVDRGAPGPDAVAPGWGLPLPALPETAGARLAALRRNYAVDVERSERVMARPATVLAFRRQADGVVRERLWIDEESGLAVRRETYAPHGALLRLGVFLSLDLAPDGAEGASGQPLGSAVEDAMPVGRAELQALRKAGWTVPTTLPGGYEAVAAYALEAEGTQPLQVVYADGLYTVSVFQQAGAADWESLPAGARAVDDLPGVVYEWPGVLPHRLTWTAEGRTWSLVGDAPADDLVRIAGALPAADAKGVVRRLQRGFSRLWSAVSEWGSNLVR
jgi:hypothetical protein